MVSSNENTLHGVLEHLHRGRRIFIILPGRGIMFAPEGVPFSHREWLLILGFSMAQADFMLETSARGYFKDDALFLYEGDFQALSRKNLSLLALHWDDLKRFFKITRKTAVFSGVKKGAAGKSWPPLYRLYPEGDKFRAEPAAKPRGKKQP